MTTITDTTDPKIVDFASLNCTTPYLYEKPPDFVFAAIRQTSVKDLGANDMKIEMFVNMSSLSKELTTQIKKELCELGYNL